MADITLFHRHKSVSVISVGPNKVRSRVSFEDRFYEASLELIVMLPHLEIVGGKGSVRPKDSLGEGVELDEYLRSIFHLKIGPGIKKQVRDLLKGVPHWELVCSMVEDGANGVILSFTKGVLLLAPKDFEGEKLHFQEMVKENPRLLNSCAALSIGSPLMEGYDGGPRPQEKR